MDGPQPGAESLPSLLDAKFAAPPDPADEDAIAHLSYTSGTTGKPKGACLAHEPTMRAANCIAERLRITSDDVSFGPTALSSSYQLVGNLLPPLHRGATVNVMGRWTQPTGWDALEKTRSSILVANPTLLTELLIESRSRGRIPERLRLTVSGGAPVPPTLKRALRDEWKLPLAESYGQSELGGFMALGDPVLVPEEKFAAAGRSLPDKDVRILDANGRECALGEVGEVCLRGGFMKGYWGKPDKTAEALRDGWLHSGDAGVMDRDGYITMRGRFAELITVAGRTWFPRDVEEALCTQAGVKEAAVVALPDAELGQRPVAYVTLTNGTVDPAALKSAIAPMVSYDLSPLTIRTLPAFPMTPTGKIAKAELRQTALADAAP
jgi:acyl-coenzyme A synthetase/AMP-(fatty) acid ligase